MSEKTTDAAGSGIGGGGVDVGDGGHGLGGLGLAAQLAGVWVFCEPAQVFRKACRVSACGCCIGTFDWLAVNAIDCGFYLVFAARTGISLKRCKGVF